MYCFYLYSSQAHLSLLEGKFIIVPIHTHNFTTTNMKYWHHAYKAYVCLVSPSFHTYVFLSVHTILQLYVNTWTILLYPLQPRYLCCTTDFYLLFYYIYCCFYVIWFHSVNILGSQTCALPLNIPTLMWISMAWW
jgi:hypothetical protein